VRIAVPDFVSSSFFPLIAAKELGIFKEEGQDVEIVHIPALGDVEAFRYNFDRSRTIIRMGKFI